MSLPSSITLSFSGAPDIVFEDFSKLGPASVVYSALSPRSDLTGRPTLRFSHETSKAGLVRSLESLIIPRYDTVAGKYDGYIKVDTVVNRSAKVPLAEVQQALAYMGHSCYVNAAVRNAIAGAQV